VGSRLATLKNLCEGLIHDCDRRRAFPRSRPVRFRPAMSAVPNVLNHSGEIKVPEPWLSPSGNGTPPDTSKRG
jgi:hypothetical protein